MPAPHPIPLEMDAQRDGSRVVLVYHSASTKMSVCYSDSQEEYRQICMPLEQSAHWQEDWKPAAEHCCHQTPFHPASEPEGRLQHDV